MLQLEPIRLYRKRTVAMTILAATTSGFDIPMRRFALLGSEYSECDAFESEPFYASHIPYHFQCKPRGTTVELHGVYSAFTIFEFGEQPLESCLECNLDVLLSVLDGHQEAVPSFVPRLGKQYLLFHRALKHWLFVRVESLEYAP